MKRATVEKRLQNVLDSIRVLRYCGSDRWGLSTERLTEIHQRVESEVRELADRWQVNGAAGAGTHEIPDDTVGQVCVPTPVIETATTAQPVPSPRYIDSEPDKPRVCGRCRRRVATTTRRWSTEKSHSVRYYCDTCKRHKTKASNGRQEKLK